MALILFIILGQVNISALSQSTVCSLAAGVVDRRGIPLQMPGGIVPHTDHHKLDEEQ